MHDLGMLYDDRQHFRPQKQVGWVCMFLYELRMWIASQHSVQSPRERAEISISLAFPADQFNHVPFSCYNHLSLKPSISLKLIPIFRAFPPIQAAVRPSIHQVCCLGF